MVNFRDRRQQNSSKFKVGKSKVLYELSKEGFSTLNFKLSNFKLTRPSHPQYRQAIAP